MASLFKCNNPYLDEDAKRALRAFKYSGSDASILYKYCYSPL